MTVPALAMAMLQVAVPLLSVVVEDVPHEVLPAVPLTDQVTVPVGVVDPVGPATVAVNVTVLPTVVGLELVTTLVGVALATLKLLELTAAVTPEMVVTPELVVGAAVKV
jgi:hypothetical protein